MLTTVLLGLLVLSVLVIAHELGHFIAAKRLGIRVERFSIGFGRKLLGFRHGETEYWISAVLFGGYVKMAGDNPEEPSPVPQPGDFLTCPWWKKAIIAAAGPFANLVLAGVFLIAMYGVGVSQPIVKSIVGPIEPNTATARSGIQELDRIDSLDGQPVTYWHQFYKIWLDGETQQKKLGTPKGHTIGVDRAGEQLSIAIPDSMEQGLLSSLQSAIPPKLGEVSVGTPAYQAGLQAGDAVRSVNGNPVHSWQDLQAQVRPNANVDLTFVIEREGRLFEKHIKPIASDPNSSEPSGIIGVMPPNEGTYLERFSAPEAVRLGIAETGFRVVQLYGGLWALFTHPRQFGSSIAGPVSVVQISGEVGKKGLSYFFYIAAFISLALMVMNLLPIPVLDGGHILFSVFEAVTGGPMAPQKMALFQRVGMAILGTIMVFALVNDFARITQRERAKGRETPVEEGSRESSGTEPKPDAVGK